VTINIVEHPVPVWGLYKRILHPGLHSLFWAGGHGPLNENRVIGFHDIFMILFTPRQTQNKTVFIERHLITKNNVTGALTVTASDRATELPMLSYNLLSG